MSSRSSYASSETSSSSSSSSSRHSSSRRHSSRYSRDSDEWTTTEGTLAPPRSLAMRFIGYAAGRPHRATGLKKKVRETSDTSSVRSAGTAGSVFAYEPETKMYWIKERGGSRRSGGSSSGGSGGGGRSRTGGGAGGFPMSGAMPAPPFGNPPPMGMPGGIPAGAAFAAAAASPAAQAARMPTGAVRFGMPGAAPPGMGRPGPMPFGGPPAPPAGFAGASVPPAA